jgi:hypothetical protein
VRGKPLRSPERYSLPCAIPDCSVASFASDNVSSDGTEFQLASITGDVTNGYVATLTVGVAA